MSVPHKTFAVETQMSSVIAGQMSDIEGGQMLVLSTQMSPAKTGQMCMGPYINLTPMWDSRGIRQVTRGPVGPCRVSDKFHWNPDLARREPSGVDRLLDCSISMHNRCVDLVEHASASPRAFWGLTGPRRPAAGGAVRLMFLNARFGWSAAAIGAARATCKLT